MAKSKRTKKTETQREGTPGAGQASRARIFLKDHPNILPLGLLFVLLLTFYHDVMLSNKTFLPPDKLASQSIKPFIDDALENGEYPLWCPYIFSGMPSFASLASAPLVDVLGTAVRAVIWPFKQIFPVSDFTFAFLNYFLLGIFTYIFLFRKTRQRFIALFAAAAMVFQPQAVAFAVFGHGTKLNTVVLIPLIFLLLDEFLEKRAWKFFSLLALAVGLQLLRAHTQMAYYTFMMVGLYLIYWIVSARISKVRWGDILKPAALAVVALGIGVAMSAWLYLSVLEYAHYSIRGGGTGLAYGYATSWSFSPAEMVTFLVPSFLGFGGQTYWGQMPFTDFPLYMGIIPLMLAGVGIVLKRDKTTIFFVVMGVLALLVSFGKNLPILYGPLFSYLPFFNKFRVPSMILILLQFSIVTLAAFGLKQLLDAPAAAHARLRKFLAIFLGVSGAVMLFMLLAKSSYLGWVAASAKRLGPQAQQAAYDMAALDSVKVFFVLLAGCALIFLYLGRKLEAKYLLYGTIALLVIDLWLVDSKIAQPQPKASQSQYFAETDAVKFLKTVKDPFRIYQAYDDKAPNWYMYHKIQSIQGYHAAKIKRYQTFLARTGFDPSARNRYGFSAFMEKYYRVAVQDGRPTLVPAQASPERHLADHAVLGMLNARYLVSYYPLPDSTFRQVVDGKPMVFENTAALPRAFFVDRIRVMPSDDDFYDYLMSGHFDPAREAVLPEDIGQRIEGSADNTVQVTTYRNEEIQLRASVKKPALMVLSEIYYPAGWHAYVDGEATQILRADGILRAVQLEPGEHQIRFVFEPATFSLGLTITSVILLLLLSLLVYDIRFRKEK